MHLTILNEVEAVDVPSLLRYIETAKYVSQLVNTELSDLKVNANGEKVIVFVRRASVVVTD